MGQSGAAVAGDEALAAAPLALKLPEVSADARDAEGLRAAAVEADRGMGMVVAALGRTVASCFGQGRALAVPCMCAAPPVHQRLLERACLFCDEQGVQPRALREKRALPVCAHRRARHAQVKLAAGKC